eukprot:366576-Chlamydomonas_euryale.AAC.1
MASTPSQFAPSSPCPVAEAHGGGGPGAGRGRPWVVHDDVPATEAGGRGGSAGALRPHKRTGGVQRRR